MSAAFEFNSSLQPSVQALLHDQKLVSSLDVLGRVGINARHRAIGKLDAASVRLPPSVPDARMLAQLHAVTVRGGSTSSAAASSQREEEDHGVMDPVDEMHVRKRAERQEGAEHDDEPLLDARCDP